MNMSPKSDLKTIKDPEIGSIYRVTKKFVCYYSDNRTSKALDEYIQGKTAGVLTRYPEIQYGSLILIVNHQTIEHKSKNYYRRLDYFQFLHENNKFMTFMANKKFLAKVPTDES